MGTSRRMILGRYDYAAFLSFFAYASASVAVPVALVSLARELNFSLAEGGMSAGGALHLGRSITIIIATLLCGFLAGRWGKRRSLGWAVMLMAFGMALCALAPVYGVLMLALLIAGFGEGIIEGIATPFVQVLHPREPGRYINFTHGFWSVGVVFTVLIVGALLSLGISWRLLIGGVALTAMIPGLILLLPHRGTPFPEHPEPLHWTTVLGHSTGILRRPRFWLFFAAMFAAGGGEFCLTFWCASYIQLSFSSAAWAGGAGTACFAAGMVLGRTGWGYLLHQHYLKQLIVFSALAGTAITLTFPLLTNLWLFFGLLFLSGVCTAPFWPSVQSYSVDRLPDSDTTMLLVLLSCAGIPGCGFFTWLMGYIGDLTGSLRAAFFLIPFCFLTLALLIGWEWWYTEREKSRKQV